MSGQQQAGDDTLPFAIKRDDGQWYVGDDLDGTPMWDADLRRARLLATYMEALGVLHELQQAGVRCQLLAVSSQ